MCRGSGYNANIISTVVDYILLFFSSWGYNANIISTVVDNRSFGSDAEMAIMPI